MQPRFVVFDAMGVLYRYGNVVNGVLIPYLRDCGCTLDDTKIRESYRRCTLGQISTAEFWAMLGVEVTASDAEYCRRHELTPGTAPVLRQLREAGITPLVLTNDAAPWSEHLRTRFDLGQYVERWFVSSELGARKPDPAAFDAVRAHPGLEPARTVLIDDRATNLAAAQAAGFEPLLFHSEDTQGHPTPGFEPASVRSMPELLSTLLAHT